MASDRLIELRSKLNPEHADIFNVLWSQTAGLHLALNSFHSLFGEKELVERMNKLAADYFGNLGQLMLRDMIATVCRLTDAAEMGKNSNLSLRQLEHFPGLNGEDKSELVSLLDQLDGQAKPLREFRNKIAFHNDLDHCLAKVELEFTPHLGMIRSCTSTITGILNFAESVFGLPTTLFHEVIEPLGGTPRFVKFLGQCLPTL